MNMISIGAIVAGLSLTLSILVVHTWSFRRMLPPKRRQYLLVLSILILGTLFIPIGDGGGHLATIHLWVAYYFLAIPEFYQASGRQLWIDSAVFLLPLAHNLTCVLLASFAVTRFQKAEQDVHGNNH